MASRSPNKTRFAQIAARLLEASAAAIFIMLMLLLLSNIVFRYLLNMPLLFADELASVLFIWLSMLGSVLAINRFEHLKLSLFIDHLSSRLRGLADAFGLILVATFLLALLPSTIQYAVAEIPIVLPSLGVSSSLRAAAIPVGVFLMTIAVFNQIWCLATPLRIVAAIICIGSILIVLLSLTDVLFDSINLNVFVLLLGLLVICLCLGVPVAFCFGIAAASFITFSTHLPLSIIVNRIDEGVSNPVLLAIPIFILLGNILDETGMGEAIVEFLASLVGHIRGGMSYVLLGALYLVSGISGSKVSDMATVAPALFPEMRRRGNKPSEMVALLGTGAVMADTVPPSIVLIVLGSVVGISIAALFASGFIVAFWLMLCLGVAARWKARKETSEGTGRPSFKFVLRLFVVAAPVIVLPFIIRGVVVRGIATATEVSAVAVLYAIFVGGTLFKGVTYKRLYILLVSSVSLSGAVVIILGTASATAWTLTQTGFADELSTFSRNLPGGWIGYMLFTIMIFIVIGSLLEGLPAIVLLGPLMFPVAVSFGIDSVHYAMVVVVAVNIGMFLPPIGIGFYLACSIGNVAPNEVLRGSIWFYTAVLLVALLILALIPEITIGLL